MYNVEPTFAGLLQAVELYESKSNVTVNRAKVFGIVLTSALYVANTTEQRELAATLEKVADSIWSDFAKDFSCMPNTGIWEAAFAKGHLEKGVTLAEKLDTVENIKDFYTLVFCFIRKCTYNFWDNCEKKEKLRNSIRKNNCKRC